MPDALALAQEHELTPVAASPPRLPPRLAGPRILERIARRPARAGRRLPVRAGARGGGAPRRARGDGAHGRGRRAAHAPRPRRVRRDALRGALRSDRRRGARPRPARGAVAGARVPRRGRPRRGSSPWARSRPGRRRSRSRTCAPRWGSLEVRARGRRRRGRRRHRGRARRGASGGTRRAGRRRHRRIDALDRGDRRRPLADRRDIAREHDRAVDARDARRVPPARRRRARGDDGGRRTPGARARRCDPRRGPVRGRSRGRRLAAIDRGGTPVGLAARLGYGLRRPRRHGDLRHVDERVLPAADFAARHDDDDPPRVARRAPEEALARAGDGIAALLLPPSLGVERPRAQALSRARGRPLRRGGRAARGPVRASLRARARPGRSRRPASSVVRARVRCVEPPRAIAGASMLEDGGQMRWTPQRSSSPPVASSAEASSTLRRRPSWRRCSLPAARPALPAARLDAPVTLGAHGTPLEAPGLALRRRARVARVALRERRR